MCSFCAQSLHPVGIEATRRAARERSTGKPESLAAYAPEVRAVTRLERVRGENAIVDLAVSARARARLRNGRRRPRARMRLGHSDGFPHEVQPRVRANRATLSRCGVRARRRRGTLPIDRESRAGAAPRCRAREERRSQHATCPVPARNAHWITSHVHGRSSRGALEQSDPSGQSVRPVAQRTPHSRPHAPPSTHSVGEGQSRRSRRAGAAAASRHAICTSKSRAASCTGRSCPSGIAHCPMSGSRRFRRSEPSHPCGAHKHPRGSPSCRHRFQGISPNRWPPSPEYIRDSRGSRNPNGNPLRRRRRPLVGSRPATEQSAESGLIRRVRW